MKIKIIQRAPTYPESGFCTSQFLLFASSHAYPCLHPFLHLSIHLLLHFQSCRPPMTSSPNTLACLSLSRGQCLLLKRKFTYSEMHTSKAHCSLNFDNFWHSCAGPASIKLESIISLPLPPALPPGNHCPDFSHQVSFAYSRTLCEWNHAVCDHASFTQCNILGRPKRLFGFPIGC